MLLLCVPMASGQGVDAVKFDSVDWTFIPATTTSGEILGFLSWTDSEVVGQNISLLWYEYDLNTGDFLTFAWKHADIGAAAIWLRMNYSEEYMFAQNSDLPDFIAVADALNIVDPKLFTGGLFDDDPLVPVITASQDPQPVIDALASIGYAVAPTISGMSVATGGNGLLQIGITPIPIDEACVAAAGSLEAMLLNDLYGRAVSFLTIGEDLPDDRSCGFCSCVTTTTYTIPAPGTWASGTYGTPGGRQTCRYTRPATKVETISGKKFWGCSPCTGGPYSTPGVQHSEVLLVPGSTCPTSPGQGASLIWHRFADPNYP
jgi:hypothetical protein